MDYDDRIAKIEDELFVKAKKGKKSTSKLQQLQQSADDLEIKLGSIQKSNDEKLATLKRRADEMERELGQSREEIKHLKIAQQYSSEYRPAASHYDHPPHYAPSHFSHEVKSECSYPHDSSFKCNPNCSHFHS
jgi:hypothetical protein